MDDILGWPSAVYDQFARVRTVLERITVRGSIVGTRQDLQEAFQFAGEGRDFPEDYAWGDYLARSSESC